VTLVAAVLGLEAVGMVVVMVLLLAELLAPNSRPSSVPSAVALAVSAAIAALGLALVARGMLRLQHWTRAAAIVWQIVQALVGLDAFQGPQSRPDLGSLLLVPAAIALILLFRGDVSGALSRR
jgi:hypothetical protein